MATRRRKRRRESNVQHLAGQSSSPLLGLRYPLTVAAIAAPSFAIYFYPYAENGVIATGIQSCLSGYASIAAAVIAMFDPNVAIHGDLIASRVFSMRIVKTCDAMEVNILLAAALAGFPMSIRRRVVAIVAWPSPCPCYSGSCSFGSRWSAARPRLTKIKQASRRFSDDEMAAR